MTISLSGQTKSYDNRTKELKLDSIQIDFQNKDHRTNDLSQPFVYNGSNLIQEKEYLRKLYNNKNLQPIEHFKINQDFIFSSVTPGSSRNFDNMPIIKPDMNGYLRIIKPDTTEIYYLRGQRPFNRYPIK
jgi:hypothetical protein